MQSELSGDESCVVLKTNALRLLHNNDTRASDDFPENRLRSFEVILVFSNEASR